MFSTATASSRRGLLSAGALWAAVLAAGCATAPEPAPEPVAPPPPVHVAEAPAPVPPPRLIFAGFALHSQAKAFRNDVLAAEKLARQMDPNALILKLANPARDQPSDWPQATLENFELVMTKMAEVARPQDRVMLLISTHSNPGTLNINIAGKNTAPITARGLSDALAPLAKTPTLVVLSACYSGAFLEPLRAPNRVVLTATDVHKASFKCQYPGEYTFFADALFNQAGAGSYRSRSGWAQPRSPSRRRKSASAWRHRRPRCLWVKKPRPGPASRSRAGWKPAEPGQGQRV